MSAVVHDRPETPHGRGGHTVQDAPLPEPHLLGPGEGATIPLLEERASVGVRAIERGRVRVTTRTDTVEETLRRTLRGDAVSVERVPVDRTIAEGETLPVPRTEGDVTIVPVLEEVLVVEKRLVLKEELRIRRITSGEDVEVPITRRVQSAVVERLTPEADAPGSPQHNDQEAHS